MKARLQPPIEEDKPIKKPAKKKNARLAGRQVIDIGQINHAFLYTGNNVNSLIKFCDQHEIDWQVETTMDKQKNVSLRMPRMGHHVWCSLKPGMYVIVRPIWSGARKNVFDIITKEQFNEKYRFYEGSAV